MFGLAFFELAARPQSRKRRARNTIPTAARTVNAPVIERVSAIIHHDLRIYRNIFHRHDNSKKSIANSARFKVRPWPRGVVDETDPVPRLLAVGDSNQVR